MSAPSTAGSAPLSARIADFIAGVEVEALPPDVRGTGDRMLRDSGGLAFAARNTAYVRAALASACTQGACTAIGHARALSP